MVNSFIVDIKASLSEACPYCISQPRSMSITRVLPKQHLLKYQEFALACIQSEKKTKSPVDVRVTPSDLFG